MEIDYNPINDILFKFIFGAEERKHITINFLNAVLDKNIREIEFHNVELNSQSYTEKLSRIRLPN
jgi:predicted transposase/invertase (TIGR01784 family)